MRHNRYIPRKRPRAIEVPNPDAQHVYQPSRSTAEKTEAVQLSLSCRLRIADAFVQAHPGRPVSAMLMELFPELEQIPWGRSDKD